MIPVGLPLVPRDSSKPPCDAAAAGVSHARLAAVRVPWRPSVSRERLELGQPEFDAPPPAAWYAADVRPERVLRVVAWLMQGFMIGAGP